MTPAAGRRVARATLRRVLSVAIVAVAVTGGLILLTMAHSLRGWSTGESAAPPLRVVAGGPPVAMARRVWIDTDAACGHAADADADDCFALLVLLQAPEIEIVGLSIVAGNAPAEAGERIVRDFVARTGRTDVPVFRGAAASGAIRAALAGGPLTIVALGPLTNVAAALRGRSELRGNVSRLVVVMGKRPGHMFHPTEGRGGGILFGHGPVFRDFNVAKDPDAVREIAAMGLDITLIPYEGARRVTITAADLARLEAAGGAAAWVVRRARAWAAHWAEIVGFDGFYPFDAVAAAYVVDPTLLDCAPVRARVVRVGRGWPRLFGREALNVEPASAPGAAPDGSAGSTHYCPGVSPRLHAWLMARFMAANDADR
jgi:inosine-uridine nucleoside N-ribohydrolase